MDAIRNPHKPRPAGEWVIGEMARQFWANAILIATPTAQNRFIDNCQTYLDAVIQEVEDKAKGRIRSLEDYFEVRRGTVGVEPSFAIGELYLNIPQQVIDHPVIAKLREIAVDLITIANDIYSKVTDGNAEKIAITLWMNSSSSGITYLYSTASWSFEGGRYFGDKGLEIQTTRFFRLTGGRGKKKSDYKHQYQQERREVGNFGI